MTAPFTDGRVRPRAGDLRGLRGGKWQSQVHSQVGSLQSP